MDSSTNRLLHAVASNAGLVHEDIHDVAGQVLRKDIRSLKDLDDREGLLVVRAFEGWHLVETVREQKGIET